YFLGRGDVFATVKNGAGQSMAGTEVTCSSRSLFGGTASGMTGANGSFLFRGVFVGPFDVSARAPATGLGGFASGNLDRDGTMASVTIILEASGTIEGRVLAADGRTPVAAAEVRMA